MLKVGKGYTKKMLASAYDSSRETLNVWLGKIGMSKPANGGYYYTPAEVMVIFQKLGTPNIEK